MMFPVMCDEISPIKRNQKLSLGDVYLKANVLQMDLKQVATLGVIDICSVSGKDVYLVLWKIQLDPSSCFIWTQEN